MNNIGIDTAASRPWRLFLVEDNASDVVILQEALQEAGLLAECEIADSGDNALLQLRLRAGDATRYAPDIILLDLNIPQKSGLEVLAAVKDDPALSSIPVLVLSTSRNERDVSESYRLHANGYLQKPLEFRQFVQMLRSVYSFWSETAVGPPPRERRKVCACAP